MAKFLIKENLFLCKLGTEKFLKILMASLAIHMYELKDGQI